MNILNHDNNQNDLKKSSSRESAHEAQNTHHPTSAAIRRMMTGRLSPRTPQQILWLQRTMGNQYVQQLIQRQEGDDTEQELPRGILGMQAFDDIPWQQYLDAVPTYEVIAGATGAELSSGSLETRSEYMWRQQQMSFTDAARQLAGRRPVGDEAHPTQSAHQDPTQAYSRRVGLSFLAYDYAPVTNNRFFGRDSSDLSDIRGMMQQGSTFRNAFEAEFAESPHLEANPTAQHIGELIRETVRQMRQSMPRDQIGELVVHFSGHGSEGGMVGVDGEVFSASQLRAVGEFARGQGVHLVVIMDICFSGNASSEAQDSALEDISRRSNNLPQDQRQGADTLILATRALIRESMLLSTLAQRVTNTAYFNGITATQFRDNVVPLIGPLRDQVDYFANVLNHTQERMPSMDPVPPDQLATLQNLIARAQANLVPARMRGREGTMNNVQGLGIFLDRASDVVNILIERGRQMVAGVSRVRTP